MRLRSNKLLLAPTDLGNFLGCKHLSSLNVSAARGLKERPTRSNPVTEALQAKGIAHEQAYLRHLQALGKTVAEVGDRARVQRTAALMNEGVDVIYQAPLSDGEWSGYADFLLKINRPCGLGDWSYEVADTKLARTTRAGTILQLCVYCHLLEKLQGHMPERMHVITPASGYAPLTYRTSDYMAYFRLLRNGIGEFVGDPGETYPELVSHCDYCVWWSECEKRRRGDDHLCYVAGISRMQIDTLRAMGIHRLAELAKLARVPKPARGSREALIRTRDQARTQAIGREQKEPYYEFREPFDEEHGLALLPSPTPDDIFLDFEGNRFVEDGVQEYLTGWVTRDTDGHEGYTALWARSIAEEKCAFERFMDTATATLQRNPGAHIYHYAPYEPAALKRLMGRYATREAELDALLRGGAFVDLHTAVKRALIASVERYSIKDLECFFGYEREQGLREASISRRAVETAIEAGVLDDAFDRHCRIVEQYNREDCVSARRLRDWLEELRTQVVAGGHEFSRPEPADGEASETVSDLDRQLRTLRDALLEGVPPDAADRSPEQHARFALAHMMEFHRREDKASWWEYFRVLALEPEEYVDERRAVTGLEFQRVVQEARAPVHRYRFSPQELDARRNDEVYIPDKIATRIGRIDDVNYAKGTIDIKKTVAASGVHPDGAVLHNRVSAKTLQESLIRFGNTIAAAGFTGQPPYRAACRLLLREPPRCADGGPLQRPGETTLEAACRLVDELDDGVLAIQGPPGTGKTFTGAQMICSLLRAGKTVGVTAVSHKVVVNLLKGAVEAARQAGFEARCVHRVSSTRPEDEPGIRYETSYPKIRGELASGKIDLLGGTAWQWARPDFQQTVDVLMVDEAGQMSLSNVLAAAPAGRSLVLLGDPQQLEQPLQSSHPEGSEVSALYHLLDGRDTISADQGLFLAETWRLHPEIARFTSEVYYEGKVSARPELENQTVLSTAAGHRFSGNGLRFFLVRHTGNQARSPEEAEAISGIVAELLDGASWQDKNREVLPLTERDILIIAPYNAQVAALTEAIPILRERIGTVDRFQGQEAPVVIYSMTSSSPQDAPRGMDFLYDRHRFNVATSRAKALCILVGSPTLFEPECTTPRQIRRANGFCRYLELARVVDP